MLQVGAAQDLSGLPMFVVSATCPSPGCRVTAPTPHFHERRIVEKVRRAVLVEQSWVSSNPPMTYHRVERQPNLRSGSHLG